MLNSSYTISATHLIPSLHVIKRNLRHKKLSKEFVLPDIKCLSTIQVKIPQCNVRNKKSSYQCSLIEDKSGSKDKLKELLTDLSENRAANLKHKRSMSYVSLNAKEERKGKNGHRLRSGEKKEARASSIENLAKGGNRQGKAAVSITSFQVPVKKTSLVKSKLSNALKRRNKSVYQPQIAYKYPSHSRFSLYSQKAQPLHNAEHIKLNKLKFPTNLRDSLVGKLLQGRPKAAVKSEDLCSFRQALNVGLREEVKLVPKLNTKWSGVPLAAIQDIQFFTHYILS